MKLPCFHKLRMLLLTPVVLLVLASVGWAAPLSAYLVKDINPGAGAGNPTPQADVNGTLYFTANDGTNGIELWQFDHTVWSSRLIPVCGE